MPLLDISVKVAHFPAANRLEKIGAMPPGKYEASGNQVVLEKSGLLHNLEKNCMVGSSATMLECMNHLALLKILNLSELLDLGFYNPLKLLNINPESIVSQTSLIFDEKNCSFKYYDKLYAVKFLSG